MATRWYIHPSIHPSIHPLIHPFFYICLIRRSGRGGAGAYPSAHRARGWVHPVRVASPSQGHTETNETNNHTHSHSLLRTIFDSPINLTCMFLDGGRKLEYPERTHAYTGRTCELHTERPQPGVEPWTQVVYLDFNLRVFLPAWINSSLGYFFIGRQSRSNVNFLVLPHY